jgi:HD-GYP domain-containing protein (c-di-GMP phosphodiesterase class II)
VCLGAQIIAVVDVFDAIVSDRPRRPSLDIDAALEELTNGSGTKYNADVVTTFIRLVKSNIIEAKFVPGRVMTSRFRSRQ